MFCCGILIQLEISTFILFIEVVADTDPDPDTDKWNKGIESLYHNQKNIW